MLHFQIKNPTFVQESFRMNIFPSLIFSRKFLLLVMCIKHLLCVRVQTALQIRWVSLFSVVCKTGEGTVHPWRPSLGSVGRFGALLGPPALWDTQGHSQGALTLQDAAQKDGSKQQWGIKHPLCVGCETLRAPEPENKLLVKARVSAPAMRRTFRKVWWDAQDKWFLKNEEKASPALFLMSWAEPEAWLGVLAAAILHPTEPGSKNWEPL